MSDSDVRFVLKYARSPASYFDTLGFKNGEWEFNFNRNINSPEKAALAWLRITHNFFALGGFKNINLTKWKSSDDTIMLISTGKACFKGGSRENYINEYFHVIIFIRIN